MSDNEKTLQFQLQKFFIEFEYIVNRILMPPAKVMFVFWTFTWIATFPTDDTVSAFQKIGVILFGYFFWCGTADLIYFIMKKKRLTYQTKITKKRFEKLSTLTDKYYPYKKILDEAKELASIINTTTDDKTLESSYDKLIESLTELKKYEPLGVFTNSPTEVLNNVIRSKEAATKRLHEEKNVPQSPTNNVISSSNNRIALYNNKYDYMSGHDFEQYCADLLRKNGFFNVEVTPGSGDHGIDILAEKDDITYAIQCKCYSSDIGNAAVQQAHTGKSLYRKDIAVVLTNQYFTRQAKKEAAALRVKLWDRDKLNDMIKISANK